MPRRPIRLVLPLLAIVIAVVPACRMSNLAIWKPAATPDDAFEVVALHDIPYCDDDDKIRHRLDLYLPKGRPDFPVVMLVHGGAWVSGDNRYFGLYSSVGRFLASNGIGTVMPNYRLAPKSKHPAQIEDVAHAFAWARAHIGEYGGRAERIFLVGHSAGGHLVALLATDDRYLKAEGLNIADIGGVVAVSGVYRIPPGKFDVSLGGHDCDSVRFDEVLPMRGESDAAAHAAHGLPIRCNLFGLAFGDDPAVRADASPLNHVRAGLPPFLLFNAENDLPGLPAMAAEFHAALVEHGVESHLVRVAGRNHSSEFFNAIERNEPVASGIIEFVNRHAAKE